MCNGMGCKYEIQSGENWGDCRKPKHGICSLDFEDGEDYRQAEMDIQDELDVIADQCYDAYKNGDCTFSAARAQYHRAAARRGMR